MMENCIWQTIKLRTFRNLLMNKNGSLHTQQKKKMSHLSVLGTMIFVVFFSLLCCCCCLCRCCRNCWIRIMRWWYFDDTTYRKIVFRPKIVNSISTTTDGHRRELTVSLTSRAHVEQDRTGEPTELRCSLPHSMPAPVGKR